MKSRRRGRTVPHILGSGLTRPDKTWGGVGNPVCEKKKQEEEKERRNSCRPKKLLTRKPGQERKRDDSNSPLWLEKKPLRTI